MISELTPPATTDAASAPTPPGWPEMVVRRAFQYVLDWALAIGSGCISGLLAGMAVMLLLKWGLVPPPAILWAPVVTFAVVAFVTELLIQIWVPLRRGGVTPGMLVMGLRVETLRGGQPGARDYLIRWLLFTIDGLLLGLVAVVSIAVTKRRQRIGDLLAQTVVVRVS